MSAQIINYSKFTINLMAKSTKQKINRKKCQEKNSGEMSAFL